MSMNSCQQVISSFAYSDVKVHDHIADGTDFYVLVRKKVGPNREGIYGPGCLFPDPPRDFVSVLV